MVSADLKYIYMKSQDVPSTMPRPDRRMGTMHMVDGETVVVVYSKPIGLTSCISV